MVKTALQRSAAQAILYAAITAVVQILLMLPDVLTLPDWLTPFVPVLVGFLKFVHLHLTTQSVDVTNNLEVKALLQAQQERIDALRRLRS